MNPFFYIPIVLYAYVALKYGLHVAKCDHDAGERWFIFDWMLAAVLFPIALIIISVESTDRYEGFELFPKPPRKPTEWDKEQATMRAEQAKADLAVEQAKARIEHRAHMEKRQTELQRIFDQEIEELDS